MIIDVILEFIFGIFGGLFSLLPSWEIPNLFPDPLVSAFHSMNLFIDIYAILTAISIVVALFIGLAIFQLIIYILQKIRILG